MNFFRRQSKSVCLGLTENLSGKQCRKSVISFFLRSETNSSSVPLVCKVRKWRQRSCLIDPQFLRISRRGFAPKHIQGIIYQQQFAMSSNDEKSATTDEKG